MKNVKVPKAEFDALLVKLLNTQPLPKKDIPSKRVRPKSPRAVVKAPKQQ